MEVIWAGVAPPLQVSVFMVKGVMVTCEGGTEGPNTSVHRYEVGRGRLYVLAAVSSRSLVDDFADRALLVPFHRQLLRLKNRKVIINRIIVRRAFHDNYKKIKSF